MNNTNITQKANIKDTILNFAIKNKTILILLKLLIAFGLIWYLIYKLDHNELIKSLENANYYLIGLAFGLMFLNIYLQYRRWELTANKLLSESDKRKIFRSFIYGISGGAFTPARVG